MQRASNPRAVIGHNNPPPDDEDESPPTVEEARIVFATIAYVQWKVQNLDDFMAKKKGKRKLGWRLVVANLIGDRARQSAVASLLQYNRKTWGENQRRLDVWSDEDAELEERLSALRAAVVSDSFVDVVALEERLLHWVKEDPGLRKLEEKKRAHILAAEEAERAAADLDAKKAERKANAKAREVEKTLKGKGDAKAIAARHAGAESVAKKLKEEGIVALAALLSGLDGRRRESDLDAKGLKCCIELGLARKAEPSQPKGVAPPPDPRYGITAFGQKVALAAIELGRIKKKKRKKAEAEDEED